jgi:urease accessory protein
MIILALGRPRALAHEGGAAGGFVTGFLHPILGWDHVAAMVAVGLWGAFLGSPAIWLLPVAFPLVMALGGALGVAGVPLPAVETGIAASAMVIGVAVALAARPPIWVAAVVVAFFAIFHGHAHGAEMPAAASPLAYAAGFVIATGLLHLAGIALGLLARSQPRCHRRARHGRRDRARRPRLPHRHAMRRGRSSPHSSRGPPRGAGPPTTPSATSARSTPTCCTRSPTRARAS